MSAAAGASEEEKLDESTMIECYKAKEITVSDNIVIFVVEGAENIDAYRKFSVVKVEEPTKLTIEEKFTYYMGNGFYSEDIFDWNDKENIWIMKKDIDFSIYENYGQNGDYTINLAMAYDRFHNGGFEQAITILDSIVYIDDCLANEVNYWKTRCYIAKGEYLNAEHFLEKVTFFSLKHKKLLVKCWEELETLESFDFMYDYIEELEKEESGSEDHKKALKLMIELCEDQSLESWYDYSIKYHDITHDVGTAKKISDYFYKKEDYTIAIGWAITCYEKFESSETALRISSCYAKIGKMQDCFEWAQKS